MKIQAYKTVEKPYEDNYKENKSLFVSKVFPISKESTVKEILTKVKKEYYDASHYCYAYRLITGDSKYSDGGEPTGTAGIRILNALSHFSLQDCLVIVIRYFGGIKLGVGALGKAYYIAAMNALKKADVIVKSPYYKCKIKVGIDLFEKVNKFLTALGCRIIETDFDSEIKLTCLLPYSDFEKLSSQLNDKFRTKLLLKNEAEIIFI